jgi:hypothetical protein
LPGGGIDYVIQIAPRELDVFMQEKHIVVDILPKLREIHSIHVVIGDAVLPQEEPLKPASATAKPAVLPAWPDFSTGPASPYRSSSYNPFAALTSTWGYPFGQSASPARRPRDSEPAKPPGESATPGPKKTRFDAWPNDDQPKLDHSAPRETAKETRKDTSKEPPKSSFPFTVAVVALLGSLGGNVYMGWITWDTRVRYHALVRRRNKGAHALRETSYETDADED